MAIEPAPDVRMLMGGVVVGDDVNVFVLRNASLDQPKKSEPFLVPMPPHTGGENRTIDRVECCEQRGRPVAFVVVCHRSASALLERKSRLRAVERLNLALLIDREHDRSLGRSEIQAHDVFELLGKVRVVAHLECTKQMRLQTMTLPDSSNRLFTDANRLRHRSRTPLRGPAWLLLGGLSHNRAHLCFAQRWLSARTRRIVRETVKTLLQKAASPESDDPRHDPELLGDLFVLLTLGGKQDDLRSAHYSGRRTTSATPHEQLLFLIVCQDDGRGDSHRWITSSIVNPIRAEYIHSFRPHYTSIRLFEQSSCLRMISESVMCDCGRQQQPMITRAYR